MATVLWIPIMKNRFLLIPWIGLYSLELIPFRSAIAAGVDGVMTAHIGFPAITNEEIPATFSHFLLQRVLRHELGFEGVVITDALDMASVRAWYSDEEAGWRAISAGADILLQPYDSVRMYQGFAAGGEWVDT